MASALGNLMANYTDSEGEEGGGGSEGEGEGNPGLAERLGRLTASPSAGGTPATDTSVKSGSLSSTPTAASKKAKLVSYHDPDAGLSDDDRSPIPMDIVSDAEEEKEAGEREEDRDERERSHLMEELWQEGVALPPEPAGHCARELQEKMEVGWRNKVEKGADYNRIIQHKKAFRNPSIYDKLIIHCNIDELGTNFPPDLYDGHLFGKESYYEELSKVQKVEMDRREKALEAKKKQGDAFTAHREKVQPGHGQQGRKSKWDIAGGGAARAGAGPVISAFGSLKKK